MEWLQDMSSYSTQLLGMNTGCSLSFPPPLSSPLSLPSIPFLLSLFPLLILSTFSSFYLQKNTHQNFPDYIVLFLKSEFDYFWCPEHSQVHPCAYLQLPSKSKPTNQTNKQTNTNEQAFVFGGL